LHGGTVVAVGRAVRIAAPFVVLALTSQASPAGAAPCALGADPTMPTCIEWMLETRHELVASASAGITASGDSRGGLMSEVARADLGYTLSFGKDVPFWAIDISAGVTGQRNDGLVSGFGASTRLALYAGPVAPPAESRYMTSGGLAPLPIDLKHEGELAALPRLSAPADVAPGTYSSEHVDLQSAVVRFAALSEEQNDAAHAIQRGYLDLIPLWGTLDATFQGGTRVGGSFGGAMLGVAAQGGHYPGHLYLLGIEDHALQLIDGTAREWTEIWVVRSEFTSRTTGTGFRLGWGQIAGEFPWPGEERDHRKSHSIGELALGDFDRFDVQYARHPYITMAGNYAYEDRVSGEAAIGTDFHIALRGFVAHTVQGNGEMIVAKDWTAGVEATGSRKISGLDVGMRAEVGRSFYASLDEAAPQPGFAARAAVSISRSVQKTLGRR
jgi:hypothetical protein